jgi:hypothetical protein
MTEYATMSTQQSRGRNSTPPTNNLSKIEQAHGRLQVIVAALRKEAATPPPATQGPPAIDVNAVLAVAQRIAEEMEHYINWARLVPSGTPTFRYDLSELGIGIASWSTAAFLALDAERLLVAPRTTSLAVHSMKGWLKVMRQGNLAGWGESLPDEAVWKLCAMDVAAEAGKVEESPPMCSPTSPAPKKAELIDGPIPPDGFRWQKHQATDLPAAQYRLLACLWDDGRRSALSIATLAEQVCPKANNKVEALRSLRFRTEESLTAAHVPLEIDQRNGHYRLKHMSE